MIITSLVGQQDPPHSDALAGDTGHLIVDGRLASAVVIGSLGEAVGQFISIDAMRSAASSVRRGASTIHTLPTHT